MLDTLSLTLMIIGTLLGVAVIILLIIGGKYDQLCEPLNSKDFPLYQLYGIGFAFLDIVKYDFSMKSERKRRQQLALIYGEKHSEYYLRVNAAERFTFALLLLVAGFVVYGLADDILILLVFALFVFAAYYYISTLPSEVLKKKTDSILNEFADVVSKLALLVNAGMVMREAWEKVAFTGEGELYAEMKHAVSDINNGVSETDAYAEFGVRCVAPEIKKFTSTIIQGMTKGNRDLVEMIKQQSREIWDAKRHRVRQQGEAAASKLLIPILVMFIGVIIMIIVPIFANLGV